METVVPNVRKHNASVCLEYAVVLYLIFLFLSFSYVICEVDDCLRAAVWNLWRFVNK